MVVDTVRRTGDQCDIIHSLFDTDIVRFVRKHDLDLIDGIRQNLIENVDIEQIAGFEGIEIGKELGAGQSGVTCKHAVRTLAADRKAGAFHMTDAFLQDILLKSVIDRVICANHGNINISNGVCDCQDAVIIKGRDLFVFTAGKSLVIFLRFLHILFQCIVAKPLYSFVISSDRDQRRIFCIPVTDDGIHKKAQSDDQQQKDSDQRQPLSEFTFRLFHAVPPMCYPKGFLVCAAG